MGSTLAFTSFEFPVEARWHPHGHASSTLVRIAGDPVQHGRVNDARDDRPLETPIDIDSQRPSARLVRTSGANQLPVVAHLPELQWHPKTSVRGTKERRANIGNFQRVLVAEDHKGTRLMLMQMLRKWGFEPVPATSGSDVLQVVGQTRPPELIIMSRMLPGLDAVDLCRRIINCNSEYAPYILMLTIQTDRRDIVRALESGAAECLTTPFEASELRARLIVATRILKRQESLINSREELRILATRDPLTDIWNRRSIQEILEEEMDRAASSERSTGVLLVDLDHFKKVNDTHGHLAGDLVLQETSRRLKNTLRVYDSIGRYGGEEFLIVVPGSAEGELRELAERLRAVIEKEPVRIGASEIRITLSIGAAIVPPRGKLLVSALAVADEALYDAKRFGRNCICVRGSAIQPVGPISNEVR